MSSPRVAHIHSAVGRDGMKTFKAQTARNSHSSIYTRVVTNQVESQQWIRVKFLLSSGGRLLRKMQLYTTLSAGPSKLLATHTQRIGVITAVLCRSTRFQLTSRAAVMLLLPVAACDEQEGRHCRSWGVRATQGIAWLAVAHSLAISITLVT